jgi:phage baseplate assembly protein W
MFEGRMELTDIKTSNWQLSLQGVGQILTDVDDINQCILTILTTVKGSDPLRPEFGVDIYKYIDAPVTTAVPNLIREIIQGIELWETRIRLTSVNYQLEDASIRFTVGWKPINSELIQTVEFIYGRTA